MIFLAIVSIVLFLFSYIYLFYNTYKNKVLSKKWVVLLLLHLFSVIMLILCLFYTEKSTFNTFKIMFYYSVVYILPIMGLTFKKTVTIDTNVVKERRLLFIKYVIIELFVLIFLYLGFLFTKKIIYMYLGIAITLILIVLLCSDLIKILRKK